MTQEWNALWRSCAATAESNPAQAYRRELVFRALAEGEDGAPQRLLDLGCGQGDFGREVTALFPHWAFRGIDISASGLDYARSKSPGALFHQADLMEPAAMPPWAGWATRVVCTEVLEHVEDPGRVLANVRPLMAPGALLLVTVPSGPRTAFDLHIGHLRHFTAKSLGDLLTEQGFEPLAVRRCGFPFFNLYRLVVLLSGRRVIAEAGRAGQPMSFAARTTLALFRFLFRCNARKWGPGWQLVAMARR